MPQYANEDEIVYDVSEGKTYEEQMAIMKHNERAKILYAQGREEERLNAPTFVEKMVQDMKKLLECSRKIRTRRNQQKSR